MSPQKRRKSMDDPAALGFVFGQAEESSHARPEPEPNPEPEFDPEPEELPEPKPTRSQRAAAPKAAKPKSKPTTTTGDIMAQLMQADAQERTIRFTADLPESLHRKLSLVALKSGKKKVEVVRTILEEVLKDVED